MSQKEPQVNYLWILNLYLNECARDITLSPSGIGTIQPSFPDDYINGVNDDAWLKHVHKVLVEKQGGLQDIPVTCSGFFSHIAREAIMLDQGPLWVFFLFLFFYEKAASMAMQKHAMLMSTRPTLERR